MSKEHQAKYQREHHARYLESLKKWREKNPHKSKLYRRTLKGYFSDVYHRMKWRCGGGDKRYLGLPVMSREEWRQFLEHTTAVRLQLFNDWKASGYQMRLAPSIDRCNSQYGYLQENCRWLTHSENSSLGGKVGGVCKNRYPAAGK